MTAHPTETAVDEAEVEAWFETPTGSTFRLVGHWPATEEPHAIQVASGGGWQTIETGDMWDTTARYNALAEALAVSERGDA